MDEEPRRYEESDYYNSGNEEAEPWSEEEEAW